MRQLPSIALLAALLAGLAAPAAAVTVKDLYKARVEVAGKGEEAREKGFRQALERVLVKVSGSRRTITNPDVAELLDDPARYVQRYSYEALEDAASGDGESAPTHRLLVTFAGPLIDRALRERELVVWGSQRPEVLVWLAVDQGNRRYLMSADGDSRAHALLSDVAERRGLPVMLPLLDTTDRSRIDFIDVKGGFFDAVQTASERYRAETLLVGHIEQRGDGWSGNWNLIGIGERRSWRGSHPGLDAALDAGVGGAASRVAALLAGQEGERGIVHLRVRGVAGLDGYARVVGYLDDLVRVSSAEVVGVRPDEAVFRVAVQGRIEELERAIELGNVLEPAPAALGDAGNGTTGGDDASGLPAGAAANQGGAGAADRSADPGQSDGSAASGGGPADSGDAEVAPRPVPPELVYRLVG